MEPLLGLAAVLLHLAFDLGMQTRDDTRYLAFTETVGLALRLTRLNLQDDRSELALPVNEPLFPSLQLLLELEPPVLLLFELLGQCGNCSSIHSV